MQKSVCLFLLLSLVALSYQKISYVRPINNAYRRPLVRKLGNADLQAQIALMEANIDKAVTASDISLPVVALGKSRNEALSDMASCIGAVGGAVVNIVALCGGFQIYQAIFLVNNIATIITTCGSFKYLRFTQSCANSVRSAADYLAVNRGPMTNAMNIPLAIQKWRAFGPKLNSVKMSCVGTS